MRSQLVGAVLLLASCGNGGGRAAQQAPAPVPAPISEYTAFGAETAVVITGHSEDAMEPFIANNGQTLFFNNSNAPNVDTELFYATRQADGSFTSRGRIMGVNSAALDGVASMDAAGNLYFVSLRSYDATRSSVHSGVFANDTVTRVAIVAGVSDRSAGVVQFDAEISNDGQTLVVADGLFTGKATPDTARLVIIDKRGTRFVRRTNSDDLLAMVNTNGLNYAPSLSADGLELFFTRIADIKAPQPVIYRATRTSAAGNFTTAQRVAAITGHVEAPSLSSDGKTLYYHKQVNGVFRIYRVVRP